MDNEYKIVEELIYNKSRGEVLMALDNIDCSKVLHLFMTLYNWDDGFEIPSKVLSKNCCELSTALLIFYQAEGIRYLLCKENFQKNGLTMWTSFVQNLYERIMRGAFQIGEIPFVPPVNKVQIYKIEKAINKGEEIFITAFSGTR